MNVGDRVELKKDDVAPAQSCGVVEKIYKNGNVKVRITHRPDCQPFQVPIIIVSIPPAALQPCHCP